MPLSILQSKTRNHLLASWKSNHGSFLLLLAVVASSIMSMIWHFDLIPNIELVSHEGRSIIANPLQRQPCLIVATTIVPKRNTNEEPIVGYLQIIPADSPISEDLVPLISREIQFGENGIQAVVISELTSGSYSALVFLDLNRNGKLDRDNDGKPTEPLQFSRPNANLETVDLASQETSFLLDASQPVNLKFNFQLQNGVPTRAATPK